MGQGWGWVCGHTWHVRLMIAAAATSTARIERGISRDLQCEISACSSACSRSAA